MSSHITLTLRFVDVGHTLKAETMVTAVPVIQLQLYLNPVLHYLVPPALVSLLVQRGTTSRGKGHTASFQ